MNISQNGAAASAAATQATDDVKRRVADAAAEAGAAVRDATEKLASAAGELGARARAEGERYGKEIVRQVEAQPVTSLAIAAMAGLLAGMFLARRR